MRNLFNKLQVWKKKQYYKKYCIPLPIDENLIVFESFLGKQYACSPKAIYEAIKNDPQYANYCFAWMFQSVNQNRMMLGDERTVIVRYGSNFLYQYNDDEVMQIKKMLGISEKKKVILYAPAQRDNQNILGAKGTSGLFDYMKEFVDSLSDEYVVLVRLRDLFVNSLSLAGYEEKVKDCSKMNELSI